MLSRSLACCQVVWDVVMEFGMLPGGGVEHGAARRSEDAVPQDQDGGHQRAARRGDPQDPPSGVNVAPLPERLHRGLAGQPAVVTAV